jgi:hypothetical protein
MVQTKTATQTECPIRSVGISNTDVALHLNSGLSQASNLRYLLVSSPGSGTAGRVAYSRARILESAVEV